jgi:ribosomal protein L30/L7E
MNTEQILQELNKIHSYTNIANYVEKECGDIEASNYIRKVNKKIKDLINKIESDE